jgi:hypothetical protein
MKKVPHFESVMDMTFVLETLTSSAKSRVQMNAPTKPSTVFFGLSLISGVRPNALPAA